jgi:hypothetical protein
MLEADMAVERKEEASSQPPMNAYYSGADGYLASLDPRIQISAKFHVSKGEPLFEKRIQGRKAFFDV